MARQLLPIVGYAIGGPIGGMVGGIIGNLVDPMVIKGPDLGDAATQTATEGAPRSIGYGRVFGAGNLIDNGRMREVPRTEGGKGGGPKTKTKRRYRTYAVRISEAPIAGLSLIKRRGKVVYDVRPGSTMLAESAKFAKGFRLHLGGESQLPDPSLEEIYGVGFTPSHKDSAYIVFIDDDVTDNGGAAWDHEFEWLSAGTTSATSVVPVEQYFSQGVTGGVTNNWLQVHEWKTTAYPLMRVRAFQNPTDSAPTKFRILANGQVIWDSGWLGAVSMQASLDSSLASIVRWRRNLEYLGLAQVDEFDQGLIQAYVRQIEGPMTGLTSVTATLVMPPSTNTITVEQIRPDNVLTTVGSLIRLDRPDLDVITEAYTALPELPGVVIGQSGATYFTALYDGVPNTLAPGAVTLASVVTDICDRCGIPASRIDVTQLTDQVRGYLLAGLYSGAEAIRALRKIYFFDAAEFDGKIRFVKRGGAVKGTITEDDLLARQQEGKRENEREYPRVMHLQYQNAAVNYNAAMESSQRDSADVRVVGERSERTAVVLTAEEAAKAIHILHNVAFCEAEGDFEFSLGDDWIGITPTDCYWYAVGSKTRRILVKKATILPGEVRVLATVDRETNYGSTAQGYEPPVPSPPPGSLAGPTLFQPLNIPALIDSHDVLGHYAAMGGVLSGWYGCVLQRRVGAAEYADLLTVDTAAITGYLTTALPAADEHYTDTTNTLRVYLHNGATLPSYTLETFLSEGGGIAICREDGTAELLQYQTAVNEGNGVWALTTLLRGRLATSSAEHAVGAPFVLLSSVQLIECESALLAQDLYYRPVSNGNTPEQSLEYRLTFSPAVMQREFPPYNLQATRSGSNVITATVIPRHRFGSDLAPVESGNFRGFRWTLVGTSTVEVDTLTPDLTYDASALGASVTLSVAQRNRYTGPGPSISRTV